MGGTALDSQGGGQVVSGGWLWVALGGRGGGPSYSAPPWVILDGCGWLWVALWVALGGRGGGPGFAALNYFRWLWVVALGVALGGRGRAQAALRRFWDMLDGCGWLWVAVGGGFGGWLWVAAVGPRLRCAAFGIC